jgi:hypothetical protein
MPASSTFVSVNGPVGMAVDTDRLLYTQLSVANSGDPAIFSVSDTGVQTVFAPTFPSAEGDVEKYIAINPGLGPWANKAHYVYVAQGNEIYEIGPDGTNVSLFASIVQAVEREPGGNVTLPGSLTGITFDSVGTFNHDMIVTFCARSTDLDLGGVLRVDSIGAVTSVTDIPEVPIHGPAVAPAGFGPHGGEIWVAAEGSGMVYAVRSDSTIMSVTNMNEIPGAENVRVIPGKLTELGASGGVYFAADYPGRITMYAASDFAHLAGNVLVGQKVSGGGIMMISESGGTYNVSQFDPSAFQGQAQDAAFVGAGRARLVYAAKFLCGHLGPSDSGPMADAPIRPGGYATTISIHNPNSYPVAITKKAVLLADDPSQEPEAPQPPTPPHNLVLGPDWGVEIDCRDIREVLLSNEGLTVAAPTFIKGWVVLEATSPLDVVVVHTAEGHQGGFALATERVHFTEVDPG